MRYKVMTFITLLILYCFRREKLLSNSHVKNWKSIVVYRIYVAQVMVYRMRDYAAVNPRARVLPCSSA